MVEQHSRRMAMLDESTATK